MSTSLDYLLGMPIYVDRALDDVPRMQLKPDFARLMPAKFVEETNTWLHEFFGTENRIYAIDGGRSIVMGPKSFAKIKDVQHA